MRTAVSATFMAFLVLCCNAFAIDAPVITTDGGNGPGEECADNKTAARLLVVMALVRCS